MGRHSLRKPPRYTRGFVDRHGKARWYFRRSGYKQVPLPGLPWAPEFMAAYEAAMNGHSSRVEIGSSRTKPGTVSALCIAYFNSPEFVALGESTKATYRNIIERFRREHGDKRVALLGKDHIKRM